MTRRIGMTNTTVALIGMGVSGGRRGGRAGDALAAAASAAAKGTPLRWHCSTAALPAESGNGTMTFLDILPGLNNAGSNASKRFVAAKKNTPFLPSNPSSSVNSWFNVWSRSSLCPAPRLPPTASSSSMKTTQGATRRASPNSSLTRAAPRPTYNSTNSEADTDKKGRPASPATALAKSVLPVPGGPLRTTPLGALAPRRA
mmetsp:Transcript_2655/g.4081  ORF Transcript_2655/g.4081 Transcript_2655/m.4081 type:complete len:201 (-) Transcript_2655:743-1345(-)